MILRPGALPGLKEILPNKKGSIPKGIVTIRKALQGGSKTFSKNIQASFIEKR